MSRETDVKELMESLNAGVFNQKLGLILSDTALGVIHFGGQKRMKGKVIIELSMEQVGENDQVIISHKLSNATPTKRGKKMEEDTTETPFFVGKGGKLTLTPPEETDGGQYQLGQEKDGKVSNITRKS